MSKREQEIKGESFKQELAELINKYSLEGESNTPDFILAKYLKKCLNAFVVVTNERDSWYGFEPDEQLLSETATKEVSND